jgi:hypothetical protein
VEERINGTIKKKNVGEEEGENIGEEVWWWMWIFFFFFFWFLIFTRLWVVFY